MDPITKGNRARDILESEVFKEAVSNARQTLKDRWTTTTAAAQRESLWHQFQALDAVEHELVLLRDRGTFERHQQEKRT